MVFKTLKQFTNSGLLGARGIYFCQKDKDDPNVLLILNGKGKRLRKEQKYKRMFGNYYYAKNDDVKAARYYKEAAKDKDDPEGLASWGFFIMGNDDRKAMEIFKTIPESEIAKKEMACWYNEEEEYGKFYECSLPLAEINDPIGLMNMSRHYDRMGERDLAIEYSMRATRMGCDDSLFDLLKFNVDVDSIVDIINERFQDDSDEEVFVGCYRLEDDPLIYANVMEIRWKLGYDKFHVTRDETPQIGVTRRQHAEMTALERITTNRYSPHDLRKEIVRTGLPQLGNVRARDSDYHFVYIYSVGINNRLALKPGSTEKDLFGRFNDYLSRPREHGNSPKNTRFFRVLLVARYETKKQMKDMEKKIRNIGKRFPLIPGQHGKTEQYEFRAWEEIYPVVIGNNDIPCMEYWGGDKRYDLNEIVGYLKIVEERYRKKFPNVSVQRTTRSRGSQVPPAVGFGPITDGDVVKDLKSVRSHRELMVISQFGGTGSRAKILFQHIPRLRTTMDLLDVPQVGPSRRENIVNFSVKRITDRRNMSRDPREQLGYLKRMQPEEFRNISGVDTIAQGIYDYARSIRDIKELIGAPGVGKGIYTSIINYINRMLLVAS